MKRAMIIMLVVFVSCAATKKQARSTEQPQALPIYVLTVPAHDPRDHGDRMRIETPCAIIDTNRADLIYQSGMLENLAEATCGEIIRQLVNLASQNPCAGFTITPTSIEYDPIACHRPRVFKGEVANIHPWAIEVRIENKDGAQIKYLKLQSRAYTQFTLPGGTYRFFAKFASEYGNYPETPPKYFEVIDDRQLIPGRLSRQPVDWVLNFP
jgi:hypothetical protein